MDYFIRNLFATKYYYKSIYKKKNLLLNCTIKKVVCYVKKMALGITSLFSRHINEP